MDLQVPRDCTTDCFCSLTTPFTTILIIIYFNQQQSLNVVGSSFGALGCNFIHSSPRPFGFLEFHMASQLAWMPVEASIVEKQTKSEVVRDTRILREWEGKTSIVS